MRGYSILLLCLVSVVSARRRPLSDSDREKLALLNQVNNVRREFANKYNISYMREMEWSRSFDEDATRFGKKCKEFFDVTEKWRVISTFNPKNDSTIPDGLFLHKNVPENSILGVWETVIPTQYRMAKVKTVCPQGVLHTMITGPRRYWSYKPIRHGEPGSECFGDQINSDGLCVIPTIQSTMSDALNQLRRNIAKEYQIANMQELVWSGFLGFEALKLAKKCNETINSTADYRYYSLDNLRFASFDDLFVHKNLTENAYIGELEKFFPTQSEWATDLKTTCPSGPLFTSFFGPHGSWKYSDIEYGEPASKCYPGQINNNGLCSTPAPGYL